jgi:hypothetical protein
MVRETATHTGECRRCHGTYKLVENGQLPPHGPGRACPGTVIKASVTPIPGRPLVKPKDKHDVSEEPQPDAVRWEVVLSDGYPAYRCSDTKDNLDHAQAVIDRNPGAKLVEVTN